MSNITYRWIDGPFADDADWQRVADIIAIRGWAPLVRELSRVLVAEADGKLVGFFPLRWLPHVDGLWVTPSARGSEVAETLVDVMKEFLDEAGATGYMAVAENPLAAKMCEARGMVRITDPVYVMPNERSN